MMKLYGKASRFIPANTSKGFIRAGYHLASLLAQTRYKVRISICPEDLARLDELKNCRSIILPNHPTPNDWLTLFLLSSRLTLPFHFMTAHEQFFGTRRLWLPKFGAYSVRRGGWGDLSSVLETQRILKRPPCSLVLFPEGRCTFSSRTVSDFKTGAVKIGINYLNRFAALGEEDLFLVPVAIRYRYLEPIDNRLIGGIDRLEHDIGTHTTGTPGDRICHLVQTTVASLEKQFGLKTPGSRESWRERIVKLCDRILRISEQSMGVHDRPRSGLMNRACNIRQLLAVHGHSRGISTRAQYEQAYFPTLLALVLESFGDLVFSQPMSFSMMADLLYSLERIVYRVPDPAPVGRREAIVRVGEKINLKHWQDDYRADKNQVTQQLLKILQAEMEYHLMREIHGADIAAPAFNL